MSHCQEPTGFEGENGRMILEGDKLAAGGHVEWSDKWGWLLIEEGDRPYTLRHQAPNTRVIGSIHKQHTRLPR